MQQTWINPEPATEICTQTAKSAHFTESRRQEIWQKRSAGGLCCVLHNCPLFLVLGDFSFLFSSQRKEEKLPQTKPYQNQICKNKTNKTKNHESTNPPNHKPLSKTLVNSLGSPCCQGSRLCRSPRVTSWDGKHACILWSTLGRRCAAAARFGTGNFGGVAVRKGRVEKPGENKKIKKPQTDFIVSW